MKQFLYLAAESFLVRRAQGSFLKDSVISKIGVTDKLGRRLENLRTARPDFDFHLVWWFRYGASEAEKELHKYYADLCQGGEIFGLPLSEIYWLEQLSSKFFEQPILNRPDWNYVRSHPWYLRDQAIRNFPYAAVEGRVINPN